MDYATTSYNGKKIFSGHFPKHEGKINKMVSLLKKYGWCFAPIPVTDVGAYYQALDGSHRIAAAQRAKQTPQIIIVNARVHPDQPIPKGWKEIAKAPLAFGKTIRGFGLLPDIHTHHVGVVEDSNQKILTEGYMKSLFDILLYLGGHGSVIKDEKNNG